MNRQGTLIEWDDARGFGFISSPEGRRIFVHVSAFPRGRRPVSGNLIRYAQAPGRNGRPSALRAEVVAARRPRPSVPDYFDRNALRVWIAAALMVLVFAALVLDRAPLWMPVLYGAMGAVSYLAYWLDKRAARSGGWRRSEMALHGLDFGFGIIGGLLGQQVFRHKTSKPGFAMATYGIALLHIWLLGGLLVEVITPAGLAEVFERP